MEELRKFVFGTVVCDGCGYRVDSQSANTERIHDIDDLLEWKLEDMGWVEKSEDKWLCPNCVAHLENHKHSGEGRVIAEKMTVSGLRCDHCGKSFENYEGYSVWEDFSDTKEHARDDDWYDIDGRWLCPDCYRTCDAMLNENFEVEDWEERYCAKCPHKDNCDEVVEREVPAVSIECKSIEHMDDSLRSSYKPCLFYSANPVKGLNGRCNLPNGQKCPRVAAWEKDKEKVKRNNEGIREWVKNRGEEASVPLKT